jgi:hypothetical protein
MFHRVALVRTDVSEERISIIRLTRISKVDFCHHDDGGEPVVLYGCETWSLTVREEHKLRVFENRVLRIFGPKRDGVTGGWRKLYNEELHNLYSSPSIIRIIKSKRMRWVGHVA